MKIKDYLAEKQMICDGAFGTFFNSMEETGMLPERANLLKPELVIRIHEEYLKNGAVLIRSNTFASNKESLECSEDKLMENLALAVDHVKEAARRLNKTAGTDYFLAGDIGPIDGSHSEQERRTEYLQIGRELIRLGTDALVFETFPDTEEILPVVEQLKKEAPECFMIVQFCVNQYGYSNIGISARRLLEDAAKSSGLDATGFNCGVGPGHLQNVYEKLSLPQHLFLTALPNAGYPRLIQNRMEFRDNADYFVEKMRDIAALGISILGGCCGTTPDYIGKLTETFQGRRIMRNLSQSPEPAKNKLSGRDSSFYGRKENQKLLAVEISPPPGADDEKVMEAVFALKNLDVDVVTFPDSPSGRSRADSVLMAKKAAEKTGLCVMPHICCRDKNAIAMRSQLLGAHINGIRNLLVITGDPVPTLIRREVKSVFNFDSVALMKMIQELNREEFANEPLCYGGAINQGRVNLDVEIARVKKKMDQGAGFFLTQPVFTKEDAKRVRKIKEETKARILCGIMPLISYRNASFIKNEMAGIQVTEEILERFTTDMSRSEGEAVGIAIAREVISFTEDFADGYYFSIPFNRVYLLHDILNVKIE